MHHDRIVSLDTIYGAEQGPSFMTGIQALVRLPMMQRRLDRRNRLDTAGLVTGYRGSPLGAYDQQLWKASRHLAAHDVVFQPGLNEDLAATALWGAQMHKAFGKTRADGVFGIWYGKGNGVDRTGDVFRNANVLGTSPLGGVLAIAGDDHAAQSSMFPHQTDGIFQSVMMPVIQPATVGEILSLGLAGFALSRFSGLWVAMKTIAEVVESAASFELPDAYPAFVSPREVVPAHGLNWDPTVAWPAQRTELERRMIDERLPAVTAWARANRLDRPVLHGGARRLCVVTVGKAHQDVMQALDNLGIGAAGAHAIGLSVYKVALSWPLDTTSLLEFADGFEEILVVEEKRPVVEEQVKFALFNRSGTRPRVTGKTDAGGGPLLPQTLEFDPLRVARAIVGRLPGTGDLRERLAALEARVPSAQVVPFPARKPFFCSGCPHNSSTKTPEGSIAGGGIGCHVMALSQPKLKTATFSQMGGEGIQWVGAAPFSETGHIFQNLGDGTYQHSGLLAIRAAVAAKANITFKILYNDAVAMTGGQPAEGAIDPARISRQLAAEGVGSIHLVSDDPVRWRAATDLAPGTTIEHRDDLDRVQRRLRETPGVTAIIYEQTCAAEKRRRRKRGAFPDPDKRIFINPRVCEGCGDCSVQSNCIAVEPVETAYGRKRRINQSSCNKDFSCIKGFCPSFVEVEGAVLRKPDGDRLKAFEAARLADLPAPALPAHDGIANIYVAGIGGLGVLTVGALLGTAAHLDGCGATVLDFTGLAQKNGAVVSQVRIAPPGMPIHAVRIDAGEIDVLLGTDVVVAAGPDTLRRIAADRSTLVLNDDETPTADIVADRDFTLPTPAMIDTLTRRAKAAHRLRATSIAEGLFGSNVAANTLLLGYAWQQGLIPLAAEAVRGAIAANGAAVALNVRAFEWGRLAAIDPALVEEMAGLAAPGPQTETTDALTARLAAELTAYQDERYAARFTALVDRARRAATGLGRDGEDFVEAVARNAYRLMAYKDEYEVARLYADPAFIAGLSEQFSGRRRLSVYLAPPILSRTDPATGRPRKRKFGPWIFPAFRLLARMKRLRGSWADPFGHSHERRAERRMIEDYAALVAELTTDLSPATLPAATGLARLPDMIRGYGPVKAAAMVEAEARKAALLDALADGRRATAAKVAA
ncbi:MULTISPECIES: indolepyruvate ferredoxin oxidoreductase family protein [unclassified Sphingomonas]|uniref:indolepyruvate ferredoxin oxidoreductase family protein n=1 Tax=unclassified Sphingomonas TaxID=196159 RepID=UPI0006FA02DA|nr:MULTISPECIES: indolepyruvate ferredoxin oxidoreductase family protein [unclassified Sphingomonas]KQX20324.1 indolepyruvate ferredoxin oxidoreductase [Sphingomonas sp. Root1294]KQY67574.1 indolepyruvate ferredoxin oxidoreductase [Sphingomonas sp. Root50]KRB90950.1 indolepyruvate ferredoxin oxidoreductase [Sphingomonas sp. Root720]